MSRRSNLFGVGIVSASLPAWADYTALPAGNFIEFTTNTPQDVGMVSGTMTNWCGGAFVPDFGARGGVGMVGGGEHNNWTDSNSSGGSGQQGVYMLDCDTRLYSRKCYPVTNHTGVSLSGFASASDTDTWGAYSDDGSPQSKHTYNAVSYMPAAWGGGSSGSLMSVAKSGGLRKSDQQAGLSGAWKFDLSSASHSVGAPSITKLTGSSTYDFGSGTPAGINDAPTACIDLTREGWWATHRAGSGQGERMVFTSKAGVISPPVGVAHGTTWAAMHHFADDDIIVKITDLNYGAAEPTTWGVYVWQANTSNAWQAATVNRQVITDTMSWGSRAGMLAYPTVGEMHPRWSSILGCFVGLDCFYPYGSDAASGQTTTIRVWKFTPPPSGQRFSGTWQITWELVTAKTGTETTNFMTHVNGGATGADGGMVNGAWGRFVECPSLRAFVWTRDVTKKGQLVRLQGM
jgi:hypothetical protein